ncbi:hypothetical protein ABZ864_40465 [Streptomyces sp. NPDC047082]|uniref:hypothetical protein n=1 Tax=Streptomyces sp. NPDC047082 TaxID=3155259 RepID=UPI0034017E9F
MAASAGLLLAVVYIAIVAAAVGIATAVCGHPSTWLARLLRSTALTVGAGLLVVASLHQIAAQLLH